MKKILCGIIIILLLGSGAVLAAKSESVKNQLNKLNKEDITNELYALEFQMSDTFITIFTYEKPNQEIVKLNKQITIFDDETNIVCSTEEYNEYKRLYTTCLDNIVSGSSDFKSIFNFYYKTIRIDRSDTFYLEISEDFEVVINPHEFIYIKVYQIL